MHILVTGGTGFLGQHVARALLARGHSVRLLGRRLDQIQPDLTAAARVAADLRDAAAVAAACRGADAVCHAGALSAPWGKRRDFMSTNIVGTDHVIAGALAAGVHRLVFISSPSVLFDGRDQHMIDDQAPLARRPLSHYSRSKQIAEQRVRAAAERGLASVILRPKAIFGPGDTTLVPRLIAAARANRLPQIGDGQNRVDLTFVTNVADAVCLAMETPTAVGGTYTITNDEHPRLWSVIGQLLASQDLPPPRRRVGLRTALLVARLLEWRAELLGGEPLLTRYSVAILARTQTYNISAARRDLGYAPRVSLSDGIARTIAAFAPQS